MFRIKINSHLITKKITVGDKTYVFESKGGRLMILGLIIGFIARYFGYTPEDIDLLLEEGFSPEELEEYFYSGRL